MEWEGQLSLGVVYDPVTEEFFVARKGEGATLNGQLIRVSREDQLVDSLLCTGFSYDQTEIQKNLELFNRIIFHSQALRRIIFHSQDGSAALDLCYVACGRFDGFWELSLNCWDIAAGRLMVEEAGGCVTAFDGSPSTIYDPELLASNAKIHSDLMGLLKSRPPNPLTA